MRRLTLLVMMVLAMLGLTTVPAIASTGSGVGVLALSAFCAAQRYACYWFGSCYYWWYYC